MILLLHIRQLICGIYDLAVYIVAFGRNIATTVRPKSCLINHAIMCCIIVT